MKLFIIKSNYTYEIEAENEQEAIEKYFETIETELGGENKLLINELAESLYAKEDKSKCKVCGITLQQDFEIEDETCNQCQAELDEKNPDVKII
jgi:superfamily I DNA and RNA helicase